MGLEPLHATRQEGGDRGVQLRVGLATDEKEVVLRAAQAFEVVVDGVVLDRGSQFVIRPAGSVVRAWTYRLQMAALREPSRAQRFARDLEQSTGLAADLAFEAETGLTRVRLGEWDRREEAVAAQNRLRGSGRDSWVVEEAGEIVDGGLQITGSQPHKVGRLATIRHANGAPLMWRGTPYRGQLQLSLNRRGSLNVALATDLEDYLRGVVPREMGPRIYDDLEALKALAIAARSYVLHNLGEFEAEGFDVCATPRCQVFGGLAAEHPLSDRAIQETAGLVLATSGRQPADALYTATCGGHTEDVSTVFPAKNHDYLQGVACIEGGLVSIDRHGDWSVVESRVVRALVEDLGSNPFEVGESFRRLVQRAGLMPGEDRLQSFAGHEVRRFLGSVLDLLINPAWLSEQGLAASSGSELELSLRQLPRGNDHVLLANLRQILYQVGQEVGLIIQQPASFISRSHNMINVRTDPLTAVAQNYSLPASTVWHWRQVDGRLLAAGDPIQLIRVDRQPVAAVVEKRARRRANGAPGTKVWSEFRSDRDLARRSAAEFPGFRYRSFELGERGISGRLKTLKLHGTGGEVRELEGLAIRWFLDIPETWFRVRRGGDDRLGPGWFFSGRGWGHGVGMCQRGAYRMALRGATFSEILNHYYRGLTVESIDTLLPISTATGER